MIAVTDVYACTCSMVYIPSNEAEKAICPACGDSSTKQIVDSIGRLRSDWLEILQDEYHSGIFDRG